MNEIQVTLVGNIGGGDPELRFTTSGIPVAKFRMACTPRVKDGTEWKDGEPSWYQITAWRALGENVAETLKNGQRVIVQGNLSVRSYEDKDGVKRTSTEVDATAVGPDLAFATAVVTKVKRTESASGGRSTAAPATARPAQSETPPSAGW
jgi:single-strand DNA-binding protein